MNGDIFAKFTKNAQEILSRSQKLSEEDKCSISTEYILLAIISVPGTLSHDILREYSVNYDQVKLVIALNSSKLKGKNEAPITRNAREVLKLSFRIASDFGHFSVDVEHILIGLLSNREFGSFQAIERIGINPEHIRSQLINIFNDLQEMDNMIKKQGINPPSSPIAEDKTSPPYDVQMPNQPNTPAVRRFEPATENKKLLEYFSCDLVERAKKRQIDPIIGREEEIDRAIQILLRKTKNNPVFIGDPGVGKTAIVEGLAQRISKGNVPPRLKRKKIFQLDLGLLVAGTIYRGQFEDRLKKIIQEVLDDKEIILFIDELHSIVGTGSAEGSMDAANILKPALAKGEIRLIGATTFDDYRKFIEKDAALERRLQPIVVREASVHETIEILEGIKSVYEEHHGVKVAQSAISAAVNFSKKYLHDRFLPDKAIDLLDEALSSKSILLSKTRQSQDLVDLRERIEKLNLRKEALISQEKFEDAAKAKMEELKLIEKERLIKKKSKPVPLSDALSDRDIAQLVSKITGIPVGELVKEDEEKYLNIEQEIEKSIAGQKEAIKELANSLRRNRSGLNQGNKPIGSFIFLGPSGVGKTEVGRSLALKIFSNENSLIKIDMSEFMERHNLARLTGAPPGYVGYEDAGKLTETVRKNPYSVILFDEIEKAHPDVFNILLQILDEGRLTDAKGRIVDFKNTIIIMTSNIGIEEYRQISKIGFASPDEPFNPHALKGVISDKLFEFFRPELINRIDKIIVFDPLEKEDLRKIAKIKIKEIIERSHEKKLEVRVTERAIDKLVELSFDPSFGARPLIRKISDEIENLLSQLILKRANKKEVVIDYTDRRFRAS